MHGRRARQALISAAFLICPFKSLFAQALPAGDKKKISSPGSPAAGREGKGERKVLWRRLPSNILGDQKRIWLFPESLAHGRHWIPTAGLLLGMAGLVALDSHDTPYFRRTQTFAGFNRGFSSLNTGLGEGLFPAVFFLVGRAHKDVYAEKTALLAVEGLADAEIVSEAMKNVSRRLRPREIPPNGDFGHTWFKAGDGILINRGSFPSGHAIGAFAMASVLARRYPRHRWVPWVAYGVAGLIGFSRISLQAHFPSDIFAGAFLGYAISRYALLPGR